VAESVERAKLSLQQNMKVSCQVDQDPRNRQRAMYVMQAVMAEEDLQTQPWASFLLLYDVLEEFPPYLIQVRGPGLMEMQRCLGAFFLVCVYIASSALFHFVPQGRLVSLPLPLALLVPGTSAIGSD
jgi:hypothetical protein